MKAFKIICNNLAYLKEKMEWNQNSKDGKSVSQSINKVKDTIIRYNW